MGEAPDTVLCGAHKSGPMAVTQAGPSKQAEHRDLGQGPMGTESSQPSALRWPCCYISPSNAPVSLCSTCDS